MVLLTTIALNLLCMLPASSSLCEQKNEKYQSGEDRSMLEAHRFLELYNEEALQVANAVTKATWGYESDLTENNKQAMLKMQEKEADFGKRMWTKATSFAWKDFKSTNNTIYRWFRELSNLGTAALPNDKINEFNELVASMQDVYGKAKICPFKGSSNAACNLALEPEITDIITNSKDYDELAYAWRAWRNESGKMIKDDFMKYVKLSDEAACLNGFDDAGEMWRDAFESKTFEEDIEDLWQTIKPLYEQLHAYVRRRLVQRYPNKGMKEDGPIPAHLLGNMWAQSWENIFDTVKPYPNKNFVDVTDTMKAKGMTPLQMFKLSEEFFTSLGLIEMTPEFWNRSIIEKPQDRELICHASAWDFFDGKDYRIKMCTVVNMETLIVIHHEMGHVQYFMQYSDLPQVFRNGANDGFHEAVGDTLALSVSTPQHLKKIGLLEEVSDDYEADINTLMQKALEKIAFIPFGYLIDAWRWRVFDGSFKENELNTKWWKLRLKYQGICPPVRRTEDDFDPGAKYHVAANVPYIRYFVSFVVQFQFHKSLCEEAGHTGPLHKCDIYRNKDAGKLLSDMLRLGSSVSWEDAMAVITKGKTHKMDATAMLEYFDPLYQWLEKQNKGEVVGWRSDDPMICP